MKFNVLSAGVLALSICVGTTAKMHAQEKTVHGINTENMDTSVKPSEDFFRYVNGTWLDKTEIPSDRTSWGSFNELRKKTDADVLGILKKAMENPDAYVLKDAQGNISGVSDQQKAIYFYQSIMDTEKRNQQGINPVMPYLNKINEVQNKEDFERLMIEMAPYGGVGFFGIGVLNDLKNSNMNAAYLFPGGLGLTQDYYLDEDEATEQIRLKYRVYIEDMLKAFNIANASEKASFIFDFEYALAKPMLTKEEQRDTRKLYNPKSLEELEALSPNLNWANYFDGIGLKNTEQIIVTQIKYMEAMNALYEVTSIDDLKTFAMWNVIRSSAGILSTDLEDRSWEFYSRDMQGAQEQRPREERALGDLNGSIGEAVGKLYVAEKFSPEAKKKAEEMIANVMLGFEERIHSLDWMSPETKEKALDKLHKMTVKIAYPDEWKDYSELNIQSVENGGSYFQNSLNLNKWNYEEDLAKVGKPVDRSEWAMAPQIVNAYFNPLNNEIVFPAAILQAPFYDPEADEAVNYGGIGAVIGHEISHSFDDSGARFDGDGNLQNWWTEEDSEKFALLGQALATQFDRVVAIGDTHLNGEFTLGENIGDLGGLNAALAGLEIFYRNNGRPEDIDGFTAEQRFFMSWATVWRTKTRDDALRNQIKTDPHAPGMYRAYMPLQNIDMFYQVFNIKEGDAMYLKPEDRVRIW